MSVGSACASLESEVMITFSSRQVRRLEVWSKKKKKKKKKKRKRKKEKSQLETGEIASFVFATDQ